VTLDGLIPALQAAIHTSKTHTNPLESTKVDKLIFAAMPFAPQYEDVFFVAPIDKLPFDVGQWKTTRYDPGQTHKLAKELAQRLKSILD